MVVAPSVLPESTLNLCCVFLCICVFIKSVWWSTIVCRLRLCACVFLIIKVILWFGGYFQTVCFASLYVCMASSLLPAINFPSRVSEPILAEDLSEDLNITSCSPSFSTIHPPPHSGSGWIDAWMRERQQRICIFNFRP